MSIDWLAIGAYYGVTGAMESRYATNLSNKIYWEAKALSSEELESRIRKLVYEADEKESMYSEIWERIEEFKRDNPTIVRSPDMDPLWTHVGKERYPFTFYQYMMTTGKRRLNNGDRDLVREYKSRVVDLLMNTYKKLSFSKAQQYVIQERKKNDAYFK